MLCCGDAREAHKEARGELTKDIYQQIEDMEYIDASKDKENLQNDMRNVWGDLREGIKECKRENKLEYC